MEPPLCAPLLSSALLSFLRASCLLAPTVKPDSPCVTSWISMTRPDGSTAVKLEVLQGQEVQEVLLTPGPRRLRGETLSLGRELHLVAAALNLEVEEEVKEVAEGESCAGGAAAQSFTSHVRSFKLNFHIFLSKMYIFCSV